MNEWMNEWMNERNVIEYTIYIPLLYIQNMKKRWLNGWMNEKMNEWINE